MAVVSENTDASPGVDPRGRDRRDTTRRARVVRSVLEDIGHGAVPVVTTAVVQDSLQISQEAAVRILDRLVSAGLLRKEHGGVWVRVTG